VLSNLATVSLLQESLNEAARLFIEAKGLQPEDPVALANEALAYFLLGDRERSFELATDARERFATSSRALMVWLDTAPATLTIEDLEAAVPPYLSEDAEVIMALARRSSSRNCDQGGLVVSVVLARREHLPVSVTQQRRRLH
jgi:hypothetical protein